MRRFRSVVQDFIDFRPILNLARLDEIAVANDICIV